MQLQNTKKKKDIKIGKKKRPTDEKEYNEC